MKVIIMMMVNQYDKVNRCLAKYSPHATTTNQHTNRAPNEPAMDRNANFGPNWVVRVNKKMTQKDNGLGPGRNYGETGVFTLCRKVVFGLKMGFTPKNHTK